MRAPRARRNRLHQSAWHRNEGQRSRGGSRGVSFIRRRNSGERNQGVDRTRAGRGGNQRSDYLRIVPARRSHSGNVERADARSASEKPCRAAFGNRHSQARDIEFFRVWRQQLQSCFRDAMRAYLRGVGIFAAGLNGWNAAEAVLAGEKPYEFAESSLPSPEILPPAERRRAASTVHCALAVAHEAISMSGI